MLKFINRLFEFVLFLLLVSCGDSDSFTIKGTIEGSPTMNVRYIYYANGRVNRGVTASREGKFEIKASSPTSTILEICDNDYRPMARMYVSNGDNIECQLKRERPYELKIKGNDISERWAKYLNENAEKLTLSVADANAAVEAYVSQYPEDIVSTLLMLTVYDASVDALHADSLMTSISQVYRPAILVDGFNAIMQRLVDQSVAKPVVAIPYYSRTDSLLSFKPSTKPWSLIVVSDDKSPRADSIVPVLRRLSKTKFRSKLQIVDLSMDIDTVRWHKSIAVDTAKWQQGWVAASIASPGIDRLGIPSLPYYIITDSTGTQHLRGCSINSIEQYINDNINTK